VDPVDPGAPCPDVQRPVEADGTQEVGGERAAGSARRSLAGASGRQGRSCVGQPACGGRRRRPRRLLPCALTVWDGCATITRRSHPAALAVS
jgi:hypothetical protein